MEQLRTEFDAIAQTLAATRPTAVNLFWAIDRMKKAFVETTARDSDRQSIAAHLIREALAIQAEDIQNNRRMGAFGQELLPNSGTILTHCNAGALATAGYGTALGVSRAAVESGKRIKVLAE